MTRSPRRLLLWVMAALAGLTVLDALAAMRLADARANAERQRDNALRCRSLAASIASLRSLPSVAGASEPANDDLARHVEAAAATAGIAKEAVIRIAPEAPRRIGDTPYLEKPAQLTLKQITLLQLAALLRQLTADASGIRATSLRISGPREGENSGHWNCEVTLTYRIYSPPPARPVRDDHVGKGDL